MKVWKATPLAVATALVLAGCAAATEPGPVPTRSLEPSWAEGATSLGELIEKADAVVVGTVESTAAAEEAEFGALTDSTIRVETWAKSASEEPETMVIRQTGGVADGVFFQIEDDPLLRVGERGVFFVRHAADRGVYVVLGGPTGRFTVTGDDAVPFPGSALGGLAPQKMDLLIQEVRGS